VALFLARGAGQHPAGHGPEVRQDVNAWLRADPVGANGRSLAVDSGIHDSLGMNDRVVGVDHGDRRRCGFGTTPSRAATDRIRAGVGACADSSDEVDDVRAATLDDSALWAGIGEQTSVLRARECPAEQP
jgi:hypothetical protein